MNCVPPQVASERTRLMAVIVCGLVILGGAAHACSGAGAASARLESVVANRATSVRPPAVVTCTVVEVRNMPGGSTMQVLAISDTASITRLGVAVMCSGVKPQRFVLGDFAHRNSRAEREEYRPIAPPPEPFSPGDTFRAARVDGRNDWLR